MEYDDIPNNPVPMKMSRQIGGMVGEFGWGGEPQDQLNVEVLSIGPTFHEIDRRWLSGETHKKAFCRKDPFPPALFKHEQLC